MRFLLYGHGGSYNHGAEAIINTTISLIRKKYCNAWIGLSTHFPEQDKQFGIQVDRLIPPDHATWDHEKKASTYNDKMALARMMYAKALSEITHDTLLISVGGDNFCYDNWHRLAVFQETANIKNARSILWGASIEPSRISDKMASVLNTYSYILARESKTFNALLKHKITSPIELVPDIAFCLPIKRIELTIQDNCVGINLSPLVLRKEIKPGMLLENYKRLIFSVIENNMSVLLIPHVTMPMDNDIDSLKKVLDELPRHQKKNVKLIDDTLSASEYKFIISKCKFMVTARTHASIASYSMKIPTIVIGYSVKSIGIANDLGIPELVLNVYSINNPFVLKKSFEQMVKNENRYHAILAKMMCGYKSNAKKYFDYI